MAGTWAAILDYERSEESSYDGDFRLPLVLAQATIKEWQCECK